MRLSLVGEMGLSTLVLDNSKWDSLNEWSKNTPPEGDAEAM